MISYGTVELQEWEALLLSNIGNSSPQADSHNLQDWGGTTGWEKQPQDPAQEMKEKDYMLYTCTFGKEWLCIIYYTVSLLALPPPLPFSEILF